MNDFENTSILTRWADIKPADFFQLSNVVLETSRLAQTESVKAVNRMATIRNWLIGFYIVEYEQNGSDRAHSMVNGFSKVWRNLSTRRD